MFKCHPFLMLTLLCLNVIACTQPDHEPGSVSVPRLSIQKLPSSSIENLLKVDDEVYSGGEPDEAAFVTLAALGVKTVVSVDGAKPDVASARKHGLRYVHIPMGYDGIKKHVRLSLRRLALEAKQPIYIHCHHGKHRGPAALAWYMMIKYGIDVSEALDILESAGTSPDYAGLWLDIKNASIANHAKDLPELVEVAQVNSIAEAMADIDRAFDNLKLCENADWKTPVSHPDLVPLHEALLLKEGLRESARNLKEPYIAEMEVWFGEAEKMAENLEASIRDRRRPIDLSRQLKAIKTSCRKCHVKYRN